MEEKRMTAAAEEERRRRFFRLSTLLIALLLFGVPFGWLTWQYRPVYERRAAKVSILSQKRGQFFLADEELVRKGMKAPAQPTGLRGWLGDQSIQRIVLDPKQVSSDEGAQIERLFPEAIVERIPKEHWQQLPDR